MTIRSRARFARFTRGIGIRQIRLGCGLVLFAYLLSHFLNHALGNISMAALATGLHYHIMFWQFPPVAVVFYGAALLHAGLGIWALYQRRQFRWKAVEPLQLVLGLSIPALIIAHVAGMRLGQALFGQERLYPQVFYADWIASPYKMWLMFTVLTVAWIHGCIGLYFWLRMKAFFKRAAPFLLAAAVLIPTLALLGLYQGGRSVVRDSASAQWRTDNLSPRQVGTPAEQQLLGDIVNDFLIFYLGLIGLVLLARTARALNERRASIVTLSYGNGRTVRVPKGLSVLEASLRHNVPHASMCGGRARCSTCRVRVISNLAALPVATAIERAVLDRIKAAVDVRLACQLRPLVDIAIVPLLPPHASTEMAFRRKAAHFGNERYLVPMFVDMRDSTRLAEQRLAFDTVFLINRFLEAASRAAFAAGGTPNQILGDGLLILFGLDVSADVAARQALDCCRKIAENVAVLNASLAPELPNPIRFGVGVHAGNVVVGDIGYERHTTFTAIGDAVNVASRLQDLSKTLNCEAVISEEVGQKAGFDLAEFPTQEVTARGRAGALRVHCVPSALQLKRLFELST